MKKNTNGYYVNSFTFNGKRYYIYGKTKQETIDKTVKKQEELKEGLDKRLNPTLTDYHDLWMSARENSVSENTLRSQDNIYKSIKDIYIPTVGRSIGEMKINEISVQDLRIVQSELNKKRSNQTVNDYMAHFKHIMKDACNERIINYNPFVVLKPLKREKEEARDTLHRALTIEEQKAFFNYDKVKNSSYYNMFKMAIYTGMRSGEIAALKQKDISDKNLKVERTITRDRKGRYLIGSNAKTKAGKRTIPINENIKQVIIDQKIINAIRIGNEDYNDVDPEDTIFKAPEGGFFKGDVADRMIKRFCKELNIEPFTMHAFRSTFATRAIESGMNPKTLQEILGHSTYNITMSLYGHALDDTKETEMNNLNIDI